MKKPNFFIIGAPKCGTTAMAEYLNGHPEIFISNPKEPLFFLHERAKHRKIIDLAHYHSLFRKADNFSAVGEASVWYLYSKHALNSIHRFNSGAKILVMTRDPCDFVMSLHSQLVFSGVEKEENIELAWNREVNRVIDDTVDSIEFLPRWQTMYPELMRHDKYIDRYKKIFGSDRVLVLSLERLRQDARSAYLRVLDFLGAQDDGRMNFPVINANKMHQSLLIHKGLNWLVRQRWAIEVVRSMKKQLGIGSFGVYRRVAEFNSREVARPEIPETVRREIEVRLARKV